MNMQIYANLCEWEKLMTYIFQERGKIDMAQFILDRKEFSAWNMQNTNCVT